MFDKKFSIVYFSKPQQNTNVSCPDSTYPSLFLDAGQGHNSTVPEHRIYDPRIGAQKTWVDDACLRGKKLIAVTPTPKYSYIQFEYTQSGCLEMW